MPRLVDANELASALQSRQGWTGDVSAIVRTTELPDFRSAIRVVNHIADVAEEMNHHPDIDIRWRRLTFSCTTHSAGGVTDLDLELAQRIDEIVRVESQG